ncbi:putative Sacsin [Gigaspora margarita]|uniref:Putative Sacsin n=1 Tax=Gigaspora margarita TaxID=4874 RepID=A0A8H3X735_GIGMA|nr:putative Sacsin [Gigaspora margarita]
MSILLSLICESRVYTSPVTTLVLEDLQFFPTVGCDVLITEDLPDDIKSIFESANFQSANKIKKLDLDGFNCLFLHELSHAPIRNWDPDTTTTFLNRRWLENLWTLFFCLDRFIDENIKDILCQLPIWPTYSADEFLWLPTHLHPNWLCEYRFIPNNTKTELRFARELYDDRILLFTTIFAGSDVFITSELRCGWFSNGLVSLGFNDKVDDVTFIRLDFEIQNLYNLPSPPSDLFYHGIFSNQLIFIPSKPVNYPYLETAKFKTPKLCSFNSLRLLKHMKLCWTQCAFYDDLVIPPESVLNAHIDLGELFFNDVMDHLVAIKENIVDKQLDYWKRHGTPDLLFTIINGLYGWLEDNLLFMKRIGEIGEQWFIRDLKSSLQKNSIIFLNGNDPFDLNNWTSATKFLNGNDPFDLNNWTSATKFLNGNDPFDLNNWTSATKFLNGNDPFDLNNWTSATKFLNGNDPFDPNNWTSATNLVLNIDIDVDCDKKAASKNLAPYGNLLQLCGAYNFIPATPTNFDVPNTALKRDNIVNKLCSCVDVDVTQNFSHSNVGLERFHDIFFNIRGELIGTCRFLLAATCPHFERAFCAGTLESKLHEHNIEITAPFLTEYCEKCIRDNTELLFDLQLHDIEQNIPDKKQRATAIVELEGKFLRWREQNSLKDMLPPIYYDEDPPITFDNESDWGGEYSFTLEWI